MQLFVDNLTNVDFSYLHPQRGLVGETWLASVVLTGDLDDQGMVCDFGIVKKTLRQWLDTTIDHCLLIPKQATQLSLTQDQNNLQIDWQFGNHKLVCASPDEALTLIDTQEITPETVATWCLDQLRRLLPNSVAQIALSFRPEVINGHYYHYSHGLKKHDGNCQRIAHGHRSTIEIFQDGQRQDLLERDWCLQWQDIYIGSKEDLIKETSINTEPYYQFAYESQQGKFTLTLPKHCCYIIDTDTTVELIAEHIAGCLKNRNPKTSLQVRAFEGIGKGAIVKA